MAWSKTWSGVTYTSAQLAGYGAFTLTTSGADGEERERIINLLIDASADIGRGLYTTSTTSVAIGTGSKSITLAAEIPFQPGAFIAVSDVANPDTNMMWGIVTARTGTSLTFNSIAVRGSGTIANWNVQISGERGADGSLTEIVDDTTPQLGGNLDGQSNDISSVTLKGVADYYEILFGGEIAAQDYVLTFASDEAKTLTDFEIGSSAGGFTGTVKINDVDAGVSATCSAGTDSDNTFSDTSVAVGESLKVNVASLTGSPSGCWARVHFTTDRVVNT